MMNKWITLTNNNGLIFFFYYCFFFWGLTPLYFKQYFIYIMATSFSGGRSRSTRREPPTTGKQLVNFITCGCDLSAPFFATYKAGLFFDIWCLDGILFFSQETWAVFFFATTFYLSNMYFLFYFHNILVY